MFTHVPPDTCLMIATFLVAVTNRRAKAGRIVPGANDDRVVVRHGGFPFFGPIVGIYAVTTDVFMCRAV